MMADIAANGSTRRDAERAAVYALCTASGAVEVRLVKQTGTRHLPATMVHVERTVLGDGSSVCQKEDGQPVLEFGRLIGSKLEPLGQVADLKRVIKCGGADKQVGT